MSIVTSHHRIITDECRANRTDAGALAEALATSQQAVEKLYGYWPAGKGAKVHIKIEIEYQDDVSHDG